MSLYNIDWSMLWQDGRYFAQLPPSVPVKAQSTSSDGTLVGEVLAVTTNLLGGAYELGTVASTFKPAEHLEVYDVLTQILPTLSEQSLFYWKRAGRQLASQLATAKYPVRSQASHLVFWWARIGGLMGVTSIDARTGEHGDSATSDGSNLEWSWAIPRETDPAGDSNFRIRFTLDPIHPEHGHRISGGAVLDYLWSNEGNMGLVRNEPGSKDWKDIIEKWLYPDIKDTKEYIEGSTYFIAFDMEPSSEITLKMYYIPPRIAPPGTEPKNRVASYRLDRLEPFRSLVKDLHPSLEASFEVFLDFVHNERMELNTAWFMIACDVKQSEKNRLKVYLLSEKRTLKDIIYDMTLGRRVTGSRVEEAMANFSKFFFHLFPYVNSEESEIKLENHIEGKDEAGRLSREDVRMMYYYEFLVGEPLPYCKVYFFMDHFSKNDLETAQATERFLREVGKPGEEGWMVKALGDVNSHRLLESRNGLHTMVSFGTKPSGWEVTNYYSAELFAPEREV